MKFTGTYVIGKGKGAFFVGLNGYKSQIKEKFMFTPFPGTFNIKVSDKVLEFLKDSPFLTIPGFEEAGRKFFPCRIRPAVIEGLPAYLIIPEKTTNPPNILEFISIFELKKELGIRPGNKVKFEL